MWHTTRRKSLAIVWAVLHFRPYLEGHLLTIHTDHDAQRWILNIADSVSQLVRLRLQLSEFELEFVWRAYINNRAVHNFLRLANNGENTSPFEDDIPPLSVATQTLKDTLANGDNVARPQMILSLTLIEILRLKATNAYYRIGQSQVIHGSSEFHVTTDSLLLRRSRVDGALQIVVPPSFCRPTLMLSNHSQIARHPSQHRMYNTLGRGFIYWSHMAVDFELIFSECQCCALKNSTYRQKCKLHLFPAAKPVQLIVADIFEPIPKTTQHSQYILVITDRCSKITRAIPTSRTTSTQVANFVFWPLPCTVWHT